MKAAKKSRPTLGLAMIMKDEIDDLERIVHSYGKYFDKIYVTATEKKTHTLVANVLAKKPAAYKNVELSYFKWIDHFGKARLHNQKQIKTDYWMWMDLDDEIEGAGKLRHVVDHMIAKDLDALVLQYETTRRTSLMEPESIRWRERIIRRESGLAWGDKAIHENIYIEGDTDMLRKDVTIKHRKTLKQKLKSGKRNLSILEKEWKRSPNPEIAKYLGATLMDYGKYKDAIEKILYSAEYSDEKTEKFRAWQRIFDCYYLLGQFNDALVAANMCIQLYSDHPEPWYKKFDAYQAINFHNTAVYCAEIAMNSNCPEGELAIKLGYDLPKYQYRGPFSVAQAYLSMGNVERAYELYQKVKNIAPEYIKEVSDTTGVNWEDKFEQAYDKFKNIPSTLTIPKIMHVIWIGDESKRPDKWIKTWRDKHPSWEYKIWGNKEFESHDWKNKELVDFYFSAGAYAGVADCMRYQILFEEGGFVHPADSVCLEPIDRLFTNPAYDAYGVYENEIVKPNFISPLYGATKGNKFAKMLMDNLPTLPPKNGPNSWLAPWVVTGNVYMMNMKKQVNYPKLKIFPSHYFTPIHHSGFAYTGMDKVYSVQQWGSTNNAEYKWPPTLDSAT